jgi:hypothetical protein
MGMIELFDKYEDLQKWYENNCLLCDSHEKCRALFSIKAHSGRVVKKLYQIIISRDIKVVPDKCDSFAPLVVKARNHRPRRKDNKQLEFNFQEEVE